MSSDKDVRYIGLGIDKIESIWVNGELYYNSDFKGGPIISLTPEGFQLLCSIPQEKDRIVKYSLKH